MRPDIFSKFPSLFIHFTLLTSIFPPLFFFLFLPISLNIFLFSHHFIFTLIISFITLTCAYLLFLHPSFVPSLPFPLISFLSSSIHSLQEIIIIIIIMDVGGGGGGGGGGASTEPGGGEGSSSQAIGSVGGSSRGAAAPSRYESQKRRDWNTFLQYLKNHKPPLSLSRCSGAHVIEFLKYLDQFGKTKVHISGCPYFGHPNPPAPCACPLRQAWGSLDALIGRLRAAYEENGGRPESNPFGARAVRIYLREVRESQAKARGIPYEKKKRKRPSSSSSSAPAPSADTDTPPAPPTEGASTTTTTAATATTHSTTSAGVGPTTTTT